MSRSYLDGSALRRRTLAAHEAAGLRRLRFHMGYLHHCPRPDDVDGGYLAS